MLARGAEPNSLCAAKYQLCAANIARKPINRRRRPTVAAAAAASVSNLAAPVAYPHHWPGVREKTNRALTLPLPFPSRDSSCRYFNDELEPIYQWIPELNKRVYSDAYERFIDKSYQVNEDVDFLLGAYKSLAATSDAPHIGAAADLDLQSSSSSSSSSDEFGAPQEASAANRRLLANKLSRLAKLGGEHSQQLLRQLRASLAMESAESSKFRALRLLQPTTELNGRFTCSVSSLDGDDLRSTRLLVYGKSLMQVNRAALRWGAATLLSRNERRNNQLAICLKSCAEFLEYVAPQTISRATSPFAASERSALATPTSRRREII